MKILQTWVTLFTRWQSNLVKVFSTPLSIAIANNLESDPTKYKDKLLTIITNTKTINIILRSFATVIEFRKLNKFILKERTKSTSICSFHEYLSFKYFHYWLFINDWLEYIYSLTLCNHLHYNFWKHIRIYKNK